MSTKLEYTTLNDWAKNNWPDPKKWLYAEAAQHQINWVRGPLAYMAWDSLLEGPKGQYDFEARQKMIVVDGVHVSKSIRLPVYRLDIGGVVTKLRGNFHDWCVRCWTPMTKEFPEWMNVLDAGNGWFEGMEKEKSPVSFVIPDTDRLFAVLWWMFNEGIK